MSTPSPSHPIRAVAIDLDGTLLANDLTISAANLAAIEELHAEGVHIVLASGRHYTSMLPFARQLPQVKYMVSAQGAYASDVENVTVIHESHLPSADTLEAIRFGLERGLSVVVYTARGIFTLSEGEWIDYYAQLAGFAPTPITQEAIVHESIFKVVYFETEARLDEIQQEAYLTETALYTVRSMKNIFELANPKTSKRSALEALIKHLDVAPEQLATFGDGNNDIPMFQLSGFSAAMDHGWPDAKKAATLVVPEGDPSESFARGVAAMRQHFASR